MPIVVLLREVHPTQQALETRIGAETIEDWLDLEPWHGMDVQDPRGIGQRLVDGLLQTVDRGIILTESGVYEGDIGLDGFNPLPRLERFDDRSTLTGTSRATAE